MGWDVLYRSAFTKDMPLADRVNIRNKLLARGAMIGGITMMYAMAMGDDDVYKNANTAERLSNWFVKIPGTDITIKLPTPFEYGILFKMLPSATAHHRSCASRHRTPCPDTSCVLPFLVAF